jgi:monoamine oxidase
MRPVMNVPISSAAHSPDDWLPEFPNPADFRFDYYKLLDLARSEGQGIGKAPRAGVRVAIIGAGAAGMTAARELYRCGYHIDIFEASNRLCGRHYTLPSCNDSTAMEMGAMRFPFFSKPGQKNALLDYYMISEANAITAPFPNPGAAPGNTGIYLNQGFGPNGIYYPNSKMDIWNYSQTPTPPPTQELRQVWLKVNRYISFFTGVVQQRYRDADWPNYWGKLAGFYDKMSFSDLVYSAEVQQDDGSGWLGGFAMTEAEAQLFYTIGAGDGSWGAFYEIGAIWFIRCVMFGFNTNLQSLIGLNNASSLPWYQYTGMVDSAGHRLGGPSYQGIQSLVEWLYYVPAPGQSKSLRQAQVDQELGLYLSTPITRIEKRPQGVRLTLKSGEMRDFDYVIATSPIWANDIDLTISGFDFQQVPLQVQTAQAEQHLIASAKVFFPLKSNYWMSGSKIPQIIVTDTFVQDAYGVNWSNSQPGVLLASYTWEDDAVKLWPYSDADLAKKVLDKLDEITQSTLGEKISDYVLADQPTIMQWSRMPGYNGCAKLYRQRNWGLNYSLLAYNQENARASNLYFAGESYSVEGGWTEPALRMAIDAVVRLLEHSCGSFTAGFSIADYPRFDTALDPSQSYCPCPATAAQAAAKS